jgi:hypothetical protein
VIQILAAIKYLMEGTHFKVPAIGGSIKRQVVNPDLLEERAKCIFDPEDMNKILFVPETNKFK